MGWSDQQRIAPQFEAERDRLPDYIITLLAPFGDQSMADFKKGDVVRLKSGGPRMTIEDIADFSDSGGPDDGVVCVWFEGPKPQKKTFDRAVLEPDKQ